MVLPIGTEYRTDLRQRIAENVDGDFYSGEAASDGSTTTLVDPKLKGGSEDHKGKEIIITDATNSIEGEITYVQSYVPTSHTLILYPALSAATKDGDTYEMHNADGPTIARINSAINQAILDATDDCVLDYEDETTLIKENYKYLYTIPTTFVGLSRIEYVSKTMIEHIIHACERTWDELQDTDVTVSLESDFRGASWVKMVVADGCAAGDIFATDSIDELDLSDCDAVAITLFSTIALTAGYLKLLFDNTAKCASPVETLSIPATTANTETTHIISLSNPQSDSAIISVGIENDTDVGAFTLRVKEIRGINTSTRIWKAIHPREWTVIQGSTPKFQISSLAHNTIPDRSPFRLQGYQKPSELSDDSTACPIDPAYVIERATATLLLQKAGIDKDMKALADDHFGLSERRLGQSATKIRPGTRWIKR